MLSLYSSVGIAACKAEHFCLAYEVEVTVDGMLQAGSGNCKVDCILLVIIVAESIDDTCGKAVTTTDTVDDICNLIVS